jgi:hypothetical protein
LTDLTSVKQSKEESVSDYLKRFKEFKNRCFNLSLTDSDLADLAGRGLRLAIRDRLEGVEFHTLANVLVRGMAQELKLNKEKEHSKPCQSNVHVVEYDYSSSLERMNLEINVVHLFVDGSVPTEEDFTDLVFGSKDAIFQKPKDIDNHLKALYMKGHINGKPISRMLVDGGAIVNLMSYSLFKKLGGSDEELMKTNMTASGVGGGEPMGAKGVISMELTIGSKTLATTFFVSETQGNFSLILGRDWIHANKCVPSTLHRMLIQWVDDEVEVVHGDNSACVAVADSHSIGVHDDEKSLSGLDLSNYEFVSCSNNGFIDAVIKSSDNRLNHFM